MSLSYVESICDLLRVRTSADRLEATEVQRVLDEDRCGFGTCEEALLWGEPTEHAVA